MPAIFPRAVLVCLALSLSLSLAADAGESPEPLVLYLVRHAEKAAQREDPPLSMTGMRRAKRIAEGLADRGIEAVWSSDYQRTRSTAAPLAERLGLEVGIYDPRAQAEFAERLVKAGINALVVGHSNTIPALASLLCGCDVTPIRDTEYGRLIVITVNGESRRLEEARQRDILRSAAQP